MEENQYFPIDAEYKTHYPYKMCPKTIAIVTNPRARIQTSWKRKAAFTGRERIR
jgi:hypothetical protein